METLLCVGRFPPQTPRADSRVSQQRGEREPVKKAEGIIYPHPLPFHSADFLLCLG